MNNQPLNHLIYFLMKALLFQATKNIKIETQIKYISKNKERMTSKKIGKEVEIKEFSKH